MNSMILTALVVTVGYWVVGGLALHLGYPSPPFWYDLGIYAVGVFVGSISTK